MRDWQTNGFFYHGRRAIQQGGFFAA